MSFHGSNTQAATQEAGTAIGYATSLATMAHKHTTYSVLKTSEQVATAKLRVVTIQEQTIEP